jgi:SulP family sulfate permease
VTAAAEAPARLERALGVALTAVVLGILTIAFNISFAAIIYQGELAAFSDRGIALTLLGAAPMAAVGALVLSFRGTVCQPQDTPAIVLSLAAGGIAAGMPDPTSERAFATIVALIVISTAAAGIAAWLLGRFRLGFVARYIPFPVLAGFLAATGYLLVMAALGMAVGARVGIANLAVLFAAENVAKWLPWALLGAATAVLMRRFENPLVLPVVILAAAAGFYPAIHLLGIGLEEARAQGLLIGPFSGGGGFLGALGEWRPLEVDWLAIATQRRAS